MSIFTPHIFVTLLWAVFPRFELEHFFVQAESDTSSLPFPFSFSFNVVSNVKHFVEALKVDQDSEVLSSPSSLMNDEVLASISYGHRFQKRKW